MKDQMFRIVVGALFLGLALWGTFARGEIAPGEMLVAYVLGTLLLIRALPFPVWKRWEAENRPPQR